MRNYWMLIWFIIGVTVGLLIPTGPAHSQSMCGEREAILKALKKNAKEELKHIGFINTGKVLEVVVSPNQETWTILISDVNGRSCVVSIGEAWTDIKGYGQPKGKGT